MILLLLARAFSDNIYSMLLSFLFGKIYISAIVALVVVMQKIMNKDSVYNIILC